ncbi:MAG: inositol monophosphatase family protein [Candidatus Thorarchaeota archaeon]
MTLLRIVQDAITAAKRVIIENLDIARELTGELNPYGDKTLLLDAKAEGAIIDVLSSSGIPFQILTEESGFIKNEGKPEYLAIIDPIDGSANLERGIPLASIGASLVPFNDAMTSDDAEMSVIESVFTHETYIAATGTGVTRNGTTVKPSAPVDINSAIISYDTKKNWDLDFMQRSLRTISSVHDIRRTASNLLDLCWTAAGFIDAMVDLRNMLPIIHLCGTHMVFTAGGYVLDQDGTRFSAALEPKTIMNFVAASNEVLARQILDKFKES